MLRPYTKEKMLVQEAACMCSIDYWEWCMIIYGIDQEQFRLISKKTKRVEGWYVGFVGSQYIELCNWKWTLPYEAGNRATHGYCMPYLCCNVISDEDKFKSTPVHIYGLYSLLHPTHRILSGGSRFLSISPWEPLIADRTWEIPF